MQPNGSIQRPPRHQPTVRPILEAWRRLTGGPEVRDQDRPTVIACSAGPDSSALAIALASANARFVLAHVVHDMRPPADAEADRQAAERLAAELETPFAEHRVKPAADHGNTEANARRLRYHALAEIAREHGCVAVATGHHADDQAETVLMRLLRGAGPTGLRGIRRRRPLASGVDLVRPMLALGRADAIELCEKVGWKPRHDHTNDDQSRLRARIRGEALPALTGLTRSANQRLLDLAQMQQDVARLLGVAADAALREAREAGPTFEWTRSSVADQPAIVLGEMTARLGRTGPPTWREAVRLAAALRDPTVVDRNLDLGGVRWRIERDRVSATPAPRD